MTDLSQLLEKVRTATAGSRELDYEIFKAFAPKERGSYWSPKIGHFYTTSLDAIVALIERELPGWSYSVAKSHGEHEPFFVARIAKALGEGVTGFDEVSDHSAALALCAAFLSALISKEKADG